MGFLGGGGGLSQRDGSRDVIRMWYLTNYKLTAMEFILDCCNGAHLEYLSETILAIQNPLSNPDAFN